MKKILGLAVFSAMIASCGGGAFAQVLTINASGTQPTYCTTEVSTTQGMALGSMAIVPQGTGFGGTLGGTSFPTLNIGTIQCSISSVQIRLTSANNCLVADTADTTCNQGGNTKEVYYRAVATWTPTSGSPVSAMIDAKGNGTTTTSLSSTSSSVSSNGPLSLTLTPYGTSNTLSNGTFTDRLTIVVGSGI